MGLWLNGISNNYCASLGHLCLADGGNLGNPEPYQFWNQPICQAKYLYPCHRPCGNECGSRKADLWSLSRPWLDTFQKESFQQERL